MMSFGYDSFNGITLKKDEEIKNKAVPSLRGLIFAWVSIPAGATLLFLVAYLPVIIRFAVSSAFKRVVMSALGVSDSADVSISDYIFRNIPDFVYGFFRFIAFVVVSAWLIWCLVMTWRCMRNSLAITNFRVIGKAGSETLDSPLNEVKNVFIEQSLWGKLFNFGSIVVLTKRKSVTFRNISDPQTIYNLLITQAENYCKSQIN